MLLGCYGVSGVKQVYIHTSPAPGKCLKILLRRRKGECKYFLGFSGAREVYLYTSPVPERYFYIYTYLIHLRRRRSLESIYIHLSPAEEVFIHTSPAPEKCLYTGTLIWRRRSRKSIYIHWLCKLFGVKACVASPLLNRSESLICES